LNINHGETIEKLEKGEIVEVIELREVLEDGRIRGRIESGWISITNTFNGKRFAEPKYFEDWRQNLNEEFGPSLRSLGWNDADIIAFVETFGDNNFSQYSSSYDTAKLIFGDLCSLYAADKRLESAFQKISQIDERKHFSSFPIRTTIITCDYNLDRALTILCDLQKKFGRYQSVQGVDDQIQPTKQKNFIERCDIGERLRPGSIQGLLIDDRDDTQDNVLNPQQIVRRQSNIERLLLAAQTGDQQSLAVIAEMVIDNGVDVNSTDASGRSALHLAAVGGHDNCLELLLTLQADLFALDSTGQSVLSEYMQAVCHDIGSLEGLRNLMEHGACPSTTDIESIEEAAEKEDATDLVKEAATSLKAMENQNKKI
jgi:hypothetical protein